ncbi:MAG: response regulator [Gaiellaceae bacterium]
MTRILVIDDEQVIRNLMVEILEDAGHAVVGASDALRALELLGEESISLVVSDIIMPGLTGLELLERVRLQRPSLPVIMVTGAGTHGNLTDALARGADGLVMKPFAHAELLDAVATALDRAGRSESELRERLLTPTLAGALANAIEARDPSLHGHCERLAALAMQLADELELDHEQLEAVRLGAILHDVGTIGIPDRILLKPGPFSPDELAVMRTHPVIGDRMLEPLQLLQGVRPVVRHHHERWDGRGYPDGLAAERIPIAARIVAVADSIEAMSARRPYREALSAAEIPRELREGRGAQWDPAIIDVVLGLIERGRLRFDGDGIRLVSGSATVERRPSKLPVLLVEGDSEHALIMKKLLEHELEDVTVAHASDVASARDLCRGVAWALVVLDDRVSDGTGLELLELLHGSKPDLPVLMLTDERSESVAIEAVRRGAADYVVKSNGYLQELTSRVRALLETA